MRWNFQRPSPILFSSLLFSSLLFYNLNFFPLHRSSYILLSYLPRTFSSLLLSTFEFIYFPPFHPTLSLPFFSSHSLSSLLFIPLSLPFFSSYSLSSLLFIPLSLPFFSSSSLSSLLFILLSLLPSFHPTLSLTFVWKKNFHPVSHRIYQIRSD